jgi:hypothetical protein
VTAPQVHRTPASPVITGRDSAAEDNKPLAAFRAAELTLRAFGVNTSAHRVKQGREAVQDALAMLREIEQRATGEDVKRIARAAVERLGGAL